MGQRAKVVDERRADAGNKNCVEVREEKDLR